MVRPKVLVTPSGAKPFRVDCRCMPGWGVPLEVGASSSIAWYDPPEWGLTRVSHLRAVRPAEVHGLEGVEVEELGWDLPDRRWRPSFSHFLRLAEKAIQWLATVHVRNGKQIVYTFLDEDFDDDWGESPRLLEDTGRLATAEDGGYSLELLPGEGHELDVGAGVFRVQIGRRRFTCLRSINLRARYLKSRATLERAILAECFYTRHGQLVLFRRYNGRLWEVGRKNSPYAGLPWDRRFPDNGRMVINGAVLVHWYDCLTDVGCGMATR
jgi:hypothetical protein